jgi:hypothetical protein
MARFEGSSEARLRDEAEADDWRERALSAASANHTNSLVPYPPPSSAPRTIPAPLLYLQTNGEVELIVLERIDKDSVCLRLVRGPKGPRRYEPLRGMIVGTVRFNVLILKDGTIRNLQVVSGHPILVQFTLGIAKDWVRDYWPRARFAPGAIEIAFTMEI